MEAVLYLVIQFSANGLLPTETLRWLATWYYEVCTVCAPLG